MSPKRGHHTGTYQPLADGRVRWKVRVTYPDGTAGRPAGTARNMTAAKAAVRKAQNDAEAGVRPVVKTLTVLEMVTEYMEAKQSSWSFRTYKNNEDLLNRYIKDKLGDLLAAGVTPRSLREYFEGLTVAHSGQHQIRSLLSGAYKRAIADGLLRENPTVHASIVKPTQAASKKAFTPEEALKFFTAAMEDRWAWPLAFMLLTGLRIGETVGLTWDDLHVEKDDSKAVYVTIKRTRSEFQGQPYENEPKTSAGNRKVYLSTDAQAVIEQVRGRIQAEAEGHGQGVGPYLFPSPLTGKPCLHDTLRGVMERTCKRAGVSRLTPHGLRHSFTSLMHAQGGTITAISAHLGHAQVSTTLNIYRTVFDSERRGVTLNLTVPPPKVEAED